MSETVKNQGIIVSTDEQAAIDLYAQLNNLDGDEALSQLLDDGLTAASEDMRSVLKAKDIK